MGEIWRSLTREQQRLVALGAGGVVLTLVVYLVTSAIVALVVAAVVAYSLGRRRSTHKTEPSVPAEPVKAEPRSRPPAQRRVRPSPQTPLARLFAERPAWSGPPVGPFEPSQRTPAQQQDPYDSA